MTRRELLRRMDRLSNQLGMSTVSAGTMQAAIELFRRVGMWPNEGTAAADATAPSSAAIPLADTEQQAPLRCTTGQDVTMPIESMHRTQPGE